MIRTLEARKLIRRERNQQNRRELQIFLTGEDRQLLADYVGPVTELEHHMVQDLTPRQCRHRPFHSLVTFRDRCLPGPPWAQGSRGHPLVLRLRLDCLDLERMPMRWQVQDAKQRFSELIRTARTEGPQVVTRHGEEIAVVIDIADYRHLTGETAEFKEYLQSGPDLGDLDLTRSTERPRTIDWVSQA